MQKHMLVYAVVISIVLTAFFNLTRIASLEAIFYLVMDIIVHWWVLRYLRKNANAPILVTAIILDIIVLGAFLWIKVSSDELVIIVALILILIVMVFAAMRWFLQEKIAIQLYLCTTCALIICYLCTVKIITLILSFYILALNALPCNDASVDVDNSQIEVAYSGDWDNNHNASDLCPPFCTCHCCHVYTIDFGATAFVPLPNPVTQEKFFHFENISNGVIFSLLQPPKA